MTSLDKQELGENQMIELKVLTIQKFKTEADYETFREMVRADYPDDFFTKLETEGQVAMQMAEENVERVTAWSYKKESGLIDTNGEKL